MRLARRRMGTALVVGSSVAVTLVWLATPALAWHPEIEAWCSGPPPVIHFRASAWAQTALGANPQIGIYFDGDRVAEGSFTAGNGYEFSGSFAAPEGETTVTVMALAEADWTGGEGDVGGQQRSVEVDLSDCVAVAQTVPTTVPEETVPTTVPEETVPTTVPEETVPTTVPEETVPTTVPEETVPTTVPEETVPTTVPETPPTTEVLAVQVTSTTTPPLATTAAPTTVPVAPTQVTETLPMTGLGGSTGLGGVGLLLVAGGAALVVAGRRRQAHTVSAAVDWE